MPILGSSGPLFDAIEFFCHYLELLVFLLVVLGSSPYVACPFRSLFLLSKLVDCSSLAVAGCPALPFLVGGAWFLQAIIARISRGSR
jgi:hypothetical protein